VDPFWFALRLGIDSSVEGWNSSNPSVADEPIWEKSNMQIEIFDAIVIGSGQGGNPLAKAMAEAGWKTAVIERKDVGGTCVNVGCTPTKTMVASARVAYLARRGSDFGVKTGAVSVDFPAVIQRKRDLVAKSRKSGEKGLEETANLTLVRGEA